MLPQKTRTRTKTKQNKKNKNKTITATTIKEIRGIQIDVVRLGRGN
jgi:hypothetical protein